MPFVKPGQSGNPAGRVKGSPNELTKTIREGVLETFYALQAQMDPKTCFKRFCKEISAGLLAHSSQVNTHRNKSRC